MPRFFLCCHWKDVARLGFGDKSTRVWERSAEFGSSCAPCLKEFLFGACSASDNQSGLSIVKSCFKLFCPPLCVHDLYCLPSVPSVAPPLHSPLAVSCGVFLLLVALEIYSNQVEVTYWDEEKFNSRVFNESGNDEATQAAAAATNGGAQ